jgi:hypothetical protein
VKDAKEADLGSQMLRVARHFAKCFGDSAEQKGCRARLDFARRAPVIRAAA